MPRKRKLSGHQERQRKKAREQARVRAEAAALGLKIATPAPGDPVAGTLVDQRRALGDAPADPKELAIAVAVHLGKLAREAELDDTLPPDRSREQASRIWALCGKHIAAAKEADAIDELEQELELLRGEVAIGVGHNPQRTKRTVSMPDGAQ